MFRLLNGSRKAVLLVLVALQTFCLTGLQAAEPQKAATVEGITEYQFDNGFRLLLFPDPSKPTVTVNLTVLVGSRHEGYGEAGMAHLLEHMVFKGTPTHPNPPQELRDRGAQFNGTTNVDRTNYFETLRASDENLEFAIRFEADRMLNSFVRREDLISEMTVVRNEFERSENSPESLLGKRMMAAAYEWHNYGKTTIGNRSDIERVPIDNLQDFYRRYYQPDNAVLIVAGKFDEAKALAYAEKYFGSLPRPERKLPSTYTEEPPQDGERLVTLRRVGDVALVEALYHVPAGSHEDFAALDLLGMILDDQPSGRLYQALVETKKASAVSSGAYGRHDPSVFDITAEVSKGVERDEVRDIMLATLQTVIDKGVTDEEVQRARQNFLNQRRQQASNTSSLAVSLSSWVAMGDWRLYFLHRDRIEKVTAADVQRVAAKYLIASNRTLGYFIPAEAPEMVTVPSTPDVSELVKNYEGRPPVAAVAEFDYSFANIEQQTQRSRLPGGVKVALLPKPTRDEVVNLSLTLRYGNLESLKGQRAVASLLPGLMARGTKRLNFQQLEDEQTRLDIEISGSNGGAGVAAFQVRAKKSTLPAALDLLRQVLREPALDAAELELLKAPQIAALEQARTDPQSLATETLTRTLSPYPADDIRFSPPAEDEIAEVKAVTIDQVRKLYEQYLGATEGELIVVGDFEAEPALKLAVDMLANWKPKQPVARIEQVAFLDVKGRRESILTPDKANAVYFGGEQISMNDQDADYPSLLLGSYVLGGSSLSSRLGDRVRQKEGLSYGVGSFFSAGSEDKVAQFMLYAIANPTNIPKVEKAIREEVEKLLKAGIPAEEFSRAQQGLLQARELNRSSDSYVITRLRRSLRMDQTLAFDEQLDTRLAGLKPDEVQAALQSNLDPERLVIVVAGDFSSSSESK